MQRYRETLGVMNYEKQGDGRRSRCVHDSGRYTNLRITSSCVCSLVVYVERLEPSNTMMTSLRLMYRNYPR